MTKGQLTVGAPPKFGGGSFAKLRFGEASLGIMQQVASPTYELWSMLRCSLFKKEPIEPLDIKSPYKELWPWLI